MTQNRSSDVGSYPGRPLDFGANIAGSGAGALFANSAYGPGAGALASVSTPGSFYMLARPVVLSAISTYIKNLATTGDQVTLQLMIDGVAVRDIVCTFDDGTAAPFPGGIYNLLTFDPVIVEAGQLVALYWPDTGGTGEVTPGLIVGFVQ